MSDQKSTAQVRDAGSQTPFGGYDPQTVITIAVDTAYVLSAGGENMSSGVYMFDNRLNIGSSGEGTMGLSTCCHVGDLIGFNVVPIDPNAGDTVSFTGFRALQDGVFGSGSPPPYSELAVNYWVTQALYGSPQAPYMLQLQITSGGLQPSTRYIELRASMGSVLA